MDVWNDTTASNGSLDERIELLIAANSELQMPRGDALDLKVLASVTGKLEDFCGKILEDGGGVDGGSATYTLLATDAAL